MNPVFLPAILSTLAPVLIVLLAIGCPVGIIWIVKNHQFRMRELEIESHRVSPGVEARLDAIEARLGNIEAALGPQRNALQDRAALLEGPATDETAQRVPVRQR